MGLSPVRPENRTRYPYFGGFRVIRRGAPLKARTVKARCTNASTMTPGDFRRMRIPLYAFLWTLASMAGQITNDRQHETRQLLNRINSAIGRVQSGDIERIEVLREEFSAEFSPKLFGAPDNDWAFKHLALTVAIVSETIRTVERFGMLVKDDILADLKNLEPIDTQTIDVNSRVGDKILAKNGSALVALAASIIDRLSPAIDPRPLNKREDQITATAK